MIVSQINTSDSKFPAFEKFQKSHPLSHFFQSGMYYQFIEGLSNFEPILLICEDEKGSILGSLLAVNQSENYNLIRNLTTRTIVSGGPLIDQHFKEPYMLLNTLLQYLIRVTKRKTFIIQFRNFFNQQSLLPIFEKYNFAFKDHLNLITSTREKDLAWSNLSKNRQRQIIRSYKNGATVVKDSSMDQFQEFYDILKELYNKKVKKPLPGWSLFEKFYHSVKQKSLGIILLIEFKGKIIGGIMCPVTHGKMLHEWYVCGLDKKYNPEGIYPSGLATWSAIEFASMNGIASFDFMGMGHPKIPYGVRDFKLRFGGELVNYGRFDRIINYPVYSIAYIGYTLIVFYKYFLSKLFPDNLL